MQSQHFGLTRLTHPGPEEEEEDINSRVQSTVRRRKGWAVTEAQGPSHTQQAHRSHFWSHTPHLPVPRLTPPELSSPRSFLLFPATPPPAPPLSPQTQPIPVGV